MKKTIHFLSAFLFLITVLSLSSCFSDGSGDGSLKSPLDDGSTESSLMLAELSLSEAGLSPVFDSQVQSYTAVASPSCETVSVTALSVSREALLSINGGEKKSWSISEEITLDSTETTVIISVSSNDSDSTRDYSISISKNSDLIKNSSFEEFEETGTAILWEMSSSSGSLLSEDISFARNGSRAARFSNLTQSISGREALSGAFGLEPGKDLTSSLYCYLPEDSIDGNTERVCISLKLYYFLDEACSEPAEPGSHTMRSRTLSGEGQWQQVSFTREAGDIPSDAAYARLAIRACYDEETGSPDSTVWLDCASVSFSGEI